MVWFLRPETKLLSISEVLGYDPEIELDVSSTAVVDIIKGDKGRNFCPMTVSSFFFSFIVGKIFFTGTQITMFRVV